MEYEIELKLLAPENAGEIIEQKFLPSLNCEFTAQKVELSNYYFDTPDRVLRQNDIGLRIRGNSNKLEQTLKTSGKSIGGLHQRPEFNVQLADKQPGVTVTPNLFLFPSDAWPKKLDITNVQKGLLTLFTTHFVRNIYLLDLGHDCQIEMVWDLGRVCANGQSTPICEIELELKKGKPADLFLLAKKLLQVVYLSIGKDSKAARGYQLADNIVQQSPNLDISGDELTSASRAIELTENALSYLQHHLNTLAQEPLYQGTVKILASLDNLEKVFQQFCKQFPNLFLDSILQRTQMLQSELLLLTSNFKGVSEKDMKLIDVSAVLFQPEVTELQLDIVEFLLDINKS